MRETAYAKINLALHVRRRREDGYHELETLFAFIDAGDRLSVEPADTLSLELTGPFGRDLKADADNLVLRAARALHDAYDRDGAVSRDWQARLGLPYGATITLEKNLPIASGIGGGSADAAAAIRLLAALWDLPDDYEQHLSIAAGLGADVPACIASQACVGTGTGIDLTLADNDLAGTPVLLVNPRVALSTAQVFAAWSGRDDGPLPKGSAREVALYGTNGLESPAIGLCFPIADVIEILRATDPMVARMSGSGATCFALYHSLAERDDAQQAIARKRPQWWTMAGRLR